MWKWLFYLYYLFSYWVNATKASVMSVAENVSPFYPCACVLSLFSCIRLCDPLDCSPPCCSVHGILQARILEWVAVPSSRGSSQPRDWTHVSYISCIGRRALYHSCHLGGDTCLNTLWTLDEYSRISFFMKVEHFIMNVSGLEFIFYIASTVSAIFTEKFILELGW